MTRNIPKTRTTNGHMIEILFWVSEKEQFFPFIKKSLHAFTSNRYNEILCLI